VRPSRSTEKLATLQTEITTLDTTIATHYRAALNGGWTPDELASANLNVPKNATRKRAPKPRKPAANASASAPAASDEAVPAGEAP